MAWRTFLAGQRAAATTIAAVSLVMGGLVLGAAPASAQASVSSWQANDDDSLLLDLKSGQYRLGQSLRGYQTATGVCVDLADMIQNLDLPVRIDKKSRRATGWIFAESEVFTLDREAGTVQTVNGTAKIAPNAVHDTPEGWCVATSALSGWFGVTFRPDLSNATLIIDSTRKLPFLEAIERKSRAARLRPVREFDLSQFPRADLPYKAFRAPSVDVNLRASIRSTPHQRQQHETQYEVLASGEIAGASFDARLASEVDGTPSTLRLRGYRADPEGRLLGPLGATMVAAGDVDTLASELTGQSAFGRGGYISNRPVTRPGRFSTTTLRGLLPAGWDAELYRNGQLIAWQADRGDGRYEFPDVDLIFGENDLEVVLYGPQGQVRRERTAVPIGPQAIPAGKTWYWGGVVEQGLDLINFARGRATPLQTGWRWGAGLERGLDQRTTIGIGTQSFMMAGRRHTYVEHLVRRSVGRFLVAADFARLVNSGSAFRLEGIGRIGTVNLQVNSLWASRRFESEQVDANRKREHRLRLDGVVRAGDFSLPWQAGVRRALGHDGEKITEWLTRGGLVGRRAALTAELSYLRTSGRYSSGADDGTKLNILGNLGLGGVRLRGDARFRLSGDRRGLESAGLVVEKRLTQRADLRATVDHYARDGRTEFGLGFVRQFDAMALRADARVGTDGMIGAGLSLAFSLGPDPVRGGIRITNERAAQTGLAAVTVFRDDDGDGLRSSGEDAVADVTVEAGYVRSDRPTNARGQALVGGLRPYEPVLVGVDQATITDPLLQPKGRGVVVVPRPGIAARIELPLAPTGEVELTLLGTDGEAREGVQLELVDPRGQVVAQTMSEFDGFVLFSSVPYGNYRVRIAPASAQALAAQGELGLSAAIGRADPVIRLGTVRLAPIAPPQRLSSAELNRAIK